MKDYVVQLKVRNNWMWQRMLLAGYGSAMELHRASGVSPTFIGKMLNLKETPITTKGAWRERVHKLAETLRCMPEDLFPPQHVTKPLPRNTAEFTANREDIEAIAGSVMAMIASPEEAVLRYEKFALLSQAMLALPPRTEYILRRRWFDDQTLQQVGDQIGLSRDRVRQIEDGAIRKLARSPALKAVMVEKQRPAWPRHYAVRRAQEEEALRKLAEAELAAEQAASAPEAEQGPE